MPTPSASDGRDALASLTDDRLDRFSRSLHALAAPGSRIGVAVSGGPDSVALLLMMAVTRPGSVIAATVDHGLRPEAADEARMVAGLCRTLNIPHAVLRVAVREDAEGIQSAARKARYAALDGWAVQQGASFLATAHHADDQAETLLMRLARGAGLAGLAGIRRARPITDACGVTLIRPLLGWTKRELEDIVAAAGVAPVRDPSNHDPRYDRTHARALLSAGWPDAARVAATANHLAEAEEALAWAARGLAVERIRFDGRKAELDASGLPRELRRRLLLAVFSQMNPDIRLRGDSIDRLLRTLDCNKAATLAGYRCDPGPPWHIVPAEARRSDRSPKKRSV